MCGIIGIAEQRSEQELATALKIIENRGKDGQAIIQTETGNFTVAHCLHAIVGGKVLQPFQNKEQTSLFAANCEIYNWKELAKQEKIIARNDAELLFLLLEKLPALDDASVQKTLNMLDGDVAFVYRRNNTLILARDVVGVKPLWFSKSPFAFSSEKKALLKLGCKGIEELNPRKILLYDLAKKDITFTEQPFFTTKPECADDKETLKKEIIKLLGKAVQKRIPERKVGVLFSGGIDSLILAKLLQDYAIPFTCYTAAIDDPTLSDAPDLLSAQNVAKDMGFSLKVKKISLEEAENYIKKVAPLIEDNNVVKVGVALTFYLACEAAKEDGVKVMLSGIGSEELFAGYERHSNALDVNEEGLAGLRKIYERDLYRDDVVTMHHGIELRVPFLDKDLIEYALRIPAEYKISEEEKKIILREAAEQLLHIPKEFAWRKKQAAQYGSKTDRALQKLAKRSNFASKSAYLKQFYDPGNVRLGALFSSGKDSTYAMWVMQQQNYEISCLITLKSKNQHSYMFHTPNIEVTAVQSEAMGIPIVYQDTEGEKEKELADLKIALQKAKEKYQIEGIVSGALYSNYQRERIEKICEELGLKVFCPLWHKDQGLYMRELLKNNVQFIFTQIAGDGLDKSWLNKIITNEDVDKLIQLHKKIGLHVAGEGGEFESLVLDAPFFKKKLVIEEAEVEEENTYTAQLIIQKVKLEEK